MIKTLVLGGGCFWCTEAIFKCVNGVIDIKPGYAGGLTTQPTYEEVCSGQSGHAEVVKINFNSFKISINKLLEIFFKTHDPTTLNRQGNDIGNQYRSVIFYSDQSEYEFFKDYIDSLNQSKLFNSSVVTKLEKLSNFYEAEEYHQNYFEKNPLNSYCNYVIKPKVEKFRNSNF